MTAQDNKRDQQQQDDRRDDPTRSRPPDTGRRNPRLVIGGLDYFDLILEQDEQK